MKWFRLLLAMFLIIGMLLCVSAVAYADPGDEDPGLDVDIVVVGDNPDVDIDVIGENSEVEVNTTGTEVWINGQNLNQPTAVYNVQNSYSSASSMGVRRVVRDVMFPYMQDIWAGLNLTVDGLAKVILLAQSNETSIADIWLKVGNHIPTRLDAQDKRLTALESESASLAGQIETLEAQDEATIAYIVAVEDYLRADYNRKLVIIIGAFSLVVIGLAIGLGVLWRRTRI